MMMLLPFAALLATPAELHPTGSWEVSEQDAGCQVERGYGGDADAVLGFETRLTGYSTIMLFAAPRAMLPATGPGEMPMTVSGQTVAVHYGLFDLEDPKLRMVRLFPETATLDAMTAAEVVEIGAAPIRLPVKGVGDALKALRACTEGLLTKWGVDPQIWRDHKMAAFGGQPGSWLTDDDADDILPRGVARGEITALVTTTTSGALASCKAVASSDPRIDKPMCDLIKRRVRLRAPLGADGKPMASYAILPFKMNR